jgi:hypothetical protein
MILHKIIPTLFLSLLISSTCVHAITGDAFTVLLERIELEAQKTSGEIADLRSKVAELNKKQEEITAKLKHIQNQNEGEHRIINSDNFPALCFACTVVAMFAFCAYGLYLSQH